MYKQNLLEFLWVEKKNFSLKKQNKREFTKCFYYLYYLNPIIFTTSTSQNEIKQKQNECFIVISS